MAITYGRAETIIAWGVVLFLAGCEHSGSSPASEERLPMAATGPALAEPTDGLGSASDDAWTRHREAQRLLKLGRTEEGYREALRAKDLFLAREERPAWVLLETIAVRNVRIEACLNLDQDVAKPPQIGIVRPLTFRILTKGPENRLLESLDFEVAVLDGKPSTAALGKSTPSEHVNFGVLDPNAKYQVIREHVLTLTDTRHAEVPPPAKTKQFLNIALPAGSEFTPLVLSASADRMMVARVCFVAGRRDIQVLEGGDGQWRPVGQNGDGITGVGGNFLQDAVVGPDGRLWVLAGYTRPSNRDRGDTHYLYVYDGMRWELTGPRQGHPSGSMADCGLGFLGNSLVHHFVGYDQVHRCNKPFLLCLNGSTWKPVAAESLLRQKPGELVWTNASAWYFVCSEKDGSTVVSAYIVTGVTEQDVSGPHPVVETPGTGFVFTSFAVSPTGDTAVILQTDDDDGEVCWFCCIVRGVGKLSENQIVKLPAPPIKYYAHTLMWSPTGELAIMDLPVDNAVAVHVCRDGQWMKTAETCQPLGDGHVFDHRLFFTAEGVPIVTWLDFFPR